jgi:hypothetical protein
MKARSARKPFGSFAPTQDGHPRRQVNHLPRDKDGLFSCHVQPNACCTNNGVPVK